MNFIGENQSQADRFQEANGGILIKRFAKIKRDFVQLSAATAMLGFALAWGLFACGPLHALDVMRGDVEEKPSSLRWQEDGASLELPLIEPVFRTALAAEPLRLFRYSPMLALAVGRGIVFKGRPGVVGADVKRSFADLSNLSVLAEWADERIFLAYVSMPALLDSTLQRLRRHQNILWAQPDVLKVPLRNYPGEVVVPHYDFAHYSVRRDLGLEDAQRYSTGKGVRIAIIDAGMDLKRSDFRDVEVAFSYDTETHSTDVSPQRQGDSHGTQVAGVVFARAADGSPRGIAPDATLIAIRLASTWTSDIVLAFHLAFLAGADVVNCSWDDPLVLQPVIEVLHHLVQHGRQGRGALVVVAAGNSRFDSSAALSMANRDEVISATALDHADTVIAAYGSGVDIAAPSMISSSSGSTDGDQQYLGKTSAAAPLVSGTIALMMAAYPELNGEALRMALLHSATPLKKNATDYRQPAFGKVAPVAALKRIASAQKQELQ
jgi:subtilisin family serine protease